MSKTFGILEAEKQLSIITLLITNMNSKLKRVVIWMSEYRSCRHIFSHLKQIRFKSLSFSVLKAILQVLIYKACMINHIWGLKQLWLQVNWHAWFHLQRLRWPVRNGEGAKNSKWKYMSPAGFEPTPRQSTTGKLQRLRPLGHAG